MRPSRMTRLIQCEVNDLEHTGFGHTPLFSGACAHFGNGHVDPTKFYQHYKSKSPVHLYNFKSQSNRIKCTWTRRLHHMYHVNTVALQLKDVCPNRIPLFQLATLHRYEMPMKAKKGMSIFWLKDPSICFPPPENCESEGSDALPGRQSKKITYAEA